MKGDIIWKHFDEDIITDKKHILHTNIFFICELLAILLLWDSVQQADCSTGMQRMSSCHLKYPLCAELWDKLYFCKLFLKYWTKVFQSGNDSSWFFNVLVTPDYMRLCYAEHFTGRAG